MPLDDDGFTFDADPLTIGEREEGPREGPPAVPEAAREGPASAPTPAPEAPPAAEPAERATFLRRAAAFLADTAVLTAMDALLLWTATAAVLIAGSVAGQQPPDADALIDDLATIGSAALAVSYFVVLIAGGGQTLGKAALGIRVTRPDGGSLGIGRSALRFAGYFLSAVPFGLGFLAALGASRRALHDHLAGSIVVRTPARGAAATRSVA